MKRPAGVTIIAVLALAVGIVDVRADGEPA